MYRIEEDLAELFEEYATGLDTSRDDAMDLARRGRLEAVKEGRYWKYRYKDVMAYKKRMGKKT